MQHSTRSHGRDSRRAERWSLLAAPQLMLLARSRRRADRRPPTAGRIPVRGSYPARRAPAHVHTDLQSSSRLPTAKGPTAERRPPTADCRLPTAVLPTCRLPSQTPTAECRPDPDSATHTPIRGFCRHVTWPRDARLITHYSHVYAPPTPCRSPRSQLRSTASHNIPRRGSGAGAARSQACKTRGRRLYTLG